MGYMVGLGEETGESCICPYCGSNLENVDFNSLVFMCSDCGEYIEFSRDNKPLMVNVKVIKEE